jgi:exopolysaccharide biosynthesis polyprenyl glycosylphosphotransferase
MQALTSDLTSCLPLPDHPINALLVRQESFLLTPARRRLLNLNVQFQRLRANWYANSATALKRAFDAAGSLVLLLAASPLLVLASLLIKWEDGGPVFFSQTRVGRNGTQFKMYKIRSMCLDAERRLQSLLSENQHSEGITFKIKHDPRITRVGGWLRKFSLDELPQLFNVLRGDMSLVGPRPPVPSEVSKYSLDQRRRLAVKPGITCLWQISGRAEIDFSGQVRLDVDYIENQSFWMDLKILARTVPAVLSGRGAY